MEGVVTPASAADRSFALPATAADSASAAAGTTASGSRSAEALELLYKEFSVSCEKSLRRVAPASLASPQIFSRRSVEPPAPKGEGEGEGSPKNQEPRAKSRAAKRRSRMRRAVRKAKGTGIAHPQSRASERALALTSTRL